jgi:hypothetical protein
MPTESIRGHSSRREPQPLEHPGVEGEDVPLELPAARTPALRTGGLSQLERVLVTVATTTRPLEAPMSTAATVLVVMRPPQRRNAAATPESTGTEQPRGAGQLTTGQREHGVRAVLGQHLALEQGALGVVLPQRLLRHAVDLGALGPPAAGEDPEPRTDTVGVDAVDPDVMLAELGRQEPDLVRLISFARAVGDVVRPGSQPVLAADVDDVAADPCWTITRAVSRETRKLPLAMTSCCRSQSCSVVSSSGLLMDSPALLTTRSTPPKASTASRTAAATCSPSLTSAATPTATSAPATPPTLAAASCASAGRGRGAPRRPLGGEPPGGGQPDA